MSTFNEIVGKDAAINFATWIYNEITDFMEDIHLNNIPKRDLAPTESEEEPWYNAILIPSFITDAHDLVWLSDDVIEDKFVVRIEKPLHRYIFSYKRNAYLEELADNLQKIAVYSIRKMEKRILTKLKKTEIIISDRYRLIPLTVEVYLPDEKYWNDNGVSISTYILRCIITFDFVDEEKYVIGGDSYKEAKERFKKRKY